MEDIKQYGDLTEKELFEFLDEIKSDDEDIQEAQSEANQKIALEEECAELSEEVNTEKESKSLFSPEVLRRAHINRLKANKQKYRQLKEDRIRIQREAFSQTHINLSDPIGDDNIKLLISLLVREHERMVNKYSAYINKRLTALLNPFIPRRLRLCKKLYPDSIRISPGFLYTASKEYGAGLTYWAVPDIPYYLTQNTEQAILIENKPSFLVNIDQAIKFYYEHLKKQTDKELKYASIIYQKKVRTYFDLLKLNPFWYEILYINLRNQK